MASDPTKAPAAARGYEQAHLAPSKFLRFEQEPVKAGRRTAVFAVLSQSSGDVLGRIAWYGPWRQYVFFPVDGTLYNVGCLEVVADRVATCNRWHRNITANFAGVS